MSSLISSGGTAIPATRIVRTAVSTNDTVPFSKSFLFDPDSGFDMHDLDLIQFPQIGKSHIHQMTAQGSHYGVPGRVSRKALK
jgi:hypothetical protein